MVYSLVHLNSFFYLKVLPNQALKHKVNFAKRSRTKGNTTNGNNNDNVQVHVEKNRDTFSSNKQNRDKY